ANVLPLGDNQYECGGYNAYLQSYDPTWGRVKSITHPVPGNHEYQTSGGTDCDPGGNASGYFTYFGSAAGPPGGGYYSFDVGEWHVIALNSNCSAVGGCDHGSPQEEWLRADLQSHSNACTLAYWHHPRFTSGSVGDDSSVAAFWEDLQSSGVDVVLNGHAHGYERFAPQDGAENYDPARGMREFVIGTGGDDFHAFAISKPLSETREDDTFGVLTLTLHSTGYDWRFLPVVGRSFADSGSTSCH
ncbi:MAG TPA: metallophosphoesterase, partial [Gaiellaceae bacterium]|nr:metallophosphoesterase [Gaiellaceae bacterium]